MVAAPSLGERNLALWACRGREPIAAGGGRWRDGQGLVPEVLSAPAISRSRSSRKRAFALAFSRFHASCFRRSSSWGGTSVSWARLRRGRPLGDLLGKCGHVGGARAGMSRAYLPIVGVAAQTKATCARIWLLRPARRVRLAPTAAFRAHKVAHVARLEEVVALGAASMRRGSRGAGQPGAPFRPDSGRRTRRRGAAPCSRRP